MGIFAAGKKEWINAELERYQKLTNEKILEFETGLADSKNWLDIYLDQLLEGPSTKYAASSLRKLNFSISDFLKTPATNKIRPVSVVAAPVVVDAVAPVVSTILNQRPKSNAELAPTQVPDKPIRPSEASDITSFMNGIRSRMASYSSAGELAKKTSLKSHTVSVNIVQDGPVSASRSLVELEQPKEVPKPEVKVPERIIEEEETATTPDKPAEKPTIVDPPKEDFAIIEALVDLEDFLGMETQDDLNVSITASTSTSYANLDNTIASQTTGSKFEQEERLLVVQEEDKEKPTSKMPMPTSKSSYSFTQTLPKQTVKVNVVQPKCTIHNGSKPTLPSASVKPAEKRKLEVTKKIVERSDLRPAEKKFKPSQKQVSKPPAIPVKTFLTSHTVAAPSAPPKVTLVGPLLSKPVTVAHDKLAAPTLQSVETSSAINSIASHKNGEVCIPEVPSDDNYDSNSDDDGGHEEAFLPPWAKPDTLMQTLRSQKNKNPDPIFGRVDTNLDLEDVFKGANLKRFRARTSSANWTKDKLTELETQRYDKFMGFSRF